MNKRIYFFLLCLASVTVVYDVRAAHPVEIGFDDDPDEDLFPADGYFGRPKVQPSETPTELAQEKAHQEELQQELLLEQEHDSDVVFSVSPNSVSARIDTLTPPPGGFTKETSANPDNPASGRPSVIAQAQSVAVLDEGTSTLVTASLPEQTLKTMRITLKNINQFIPLLAGEDQTAQFVPHAIRILELMENFEKEVSSRDLQKLGVTQEFARTKLLLESSINNKQIQVASKLLELYGTYESNADADSSAFSQDFKTQALALFGDRVTSFTLQDPALQGYFDFKSKVQNFLQAPGALDRPAFLKLVTEQLKVAIDEQSNLQLKMANALKTPLVTTDPDFEASFARAMEALDTQNKQLQQASQNAVTDEVDALVVEPVTDDALPTTDPNYQKFIKQKAADNQAFEAIASKLTVMENSPENYTTTEVAQTLKSLKQLVNSMSIRSVFPKSSSAYKARAQFIAGLEEKISAIEKSLGGQLPLFKPSFTKVSWSFFSDENYTVWDRIVSTFKGGGRKFTNSTQEINDEKTFVALAKAAHQFVQEVSDPADNYYSLSDVADALEFVDRLDTQMQQLQTMGAKKLYAKVQEALQSVSEDNSVAIKPAQKVTVSGLREQLQMVVKEKVVALLQDPKVSVPELEEASTALKGMNDPVIKQINALLKVKQMLQAGGTGLDYSVFIEGLQSLRNLTITGIDPMVIEGLRTALKDKIMQFGRKIINDPNMSLGDISETEVLFKSLPDSDAQVLDILKMLKALYVVKSPNAELLDMQKAAKALTGVSVEGAKKIQTELYGLIDDVFDPIIEEVGVPLSVSVEDVSLEPLGREFFENPVAAKKIIEALYNDLETKTSSLLKEIEDKPTDSQMRQLTSLKEDIQYMGMNFIGYITDPSGVTLHYSECLPQEVRALLLTADPQALTLDQQKAWVRSLLLLNDDGTLQGNIYKSQNILRKIVLQIASDSSSGDLGDDLVTQLNEMAVQSSKKPFNFSDDLVSRITEKLVASIKAQGPFLEVISKIDAEFPRTLLTIKEHQKIPHLGKAYRDLSFSFGPMTRPYFVRQYVCGMPEAPIVNLSKEEKESFVERQMQIFMTVSELINQN